MSDDELLEYLAHDEGYEDGDALVEAKVLSSVQPGICRDPDCLATTTHCEPDARENWCCGCEEQTVASVAVLAGFC